VGGCAYPSQACLRSRCLRKLSPSPLFMEWSRAEEALYQPTHPAPLTERLVVDGWVVAEAQALHAHPIHHHAPPSIHPSTTYRTRACFPSLTHSHPRSEPLLSSSGRGIVGHACSGGAPSRPTGVASAAKASTHLRCPRPTRAAHTYTHSPSTLSLASWDG
jgi:hypothetical protein